MTEEHVIIIGGGLVGVSVALHCQLKGNKVILFDANHEGTATKAGAGIISPETTHSLDDKWFEYAIECGKYYDHFIHQILDLSDTSIYDKTGEITIAIDEDEVAEHLKLQGIILDRQKQTNYPEKGKIRPINFSDTHEIFTGLSKFRAGLYNENAARIEGHLLRNKILEKSRSLGLKYIISEVTSLLIEDGSIKGVKDLKKKYSASKVIICGGAWSSKFEKQLNLNRMVKPQRGQILHSKIENWDQPTCVIRGYKGHYLVPWNDGRFAFGATRESDAGFTPKSTLKGITEVISNGTRLFPQLADSELIEVKIGLRPESMDGIPIIGNLSTHPNLFLATGMGPSGLQLGPMTGKVIADLIHNTNEIDINYFNPDRFQAYE